jgi:hypothetical protein
VIQSVLPLHDCADHAAEEEATADPTVVEFLHFAADPVGFGVALTETFCLCVQV